MIITPKVSTSRFNAAYRQRTIEGLAVRVNPEAAALATPPPLLLRTYLFTHFTSLPTDRFPV